MFDLSLWALGTAIGLFILHQRMVNSIGLGNDRLVDLNKVGNISIIMPTLNEALLVERALVSLQDQNVRVAYPERFEVIVVDSASQDETVQIARKYADRVLTAPRGKLTAMDIGIREARGDIIVAVDADCNYNVNFLNLLLRHFENPNVVAVSGVEFMEHHEILSLLVENYVYAVKPRLHGRGSAYRKQAYFDIGGFNLDINQQDVYSMMNEEEFGLWLRMSQVGECVRETRASVVASARRLECAHCQINKTEECAYCQEVTAGQRF